MTADNPNAEAIPSCSKCSTEGFPVYYRNGRCPECNAPAEESQPPGAGPADGPPECFGGERALAKCADTGWVDLRPAPVAGTPEQPDPTIELALEQMRFGCPLKPDLSKDAEDYELRMQVAADVIESALAVANAEIERLRDVLEMTTDVLEEFDTVIWDDGCPVEYRATQEEAIRALKNGGREIPMRVENKRLIAERDALRKALEGLLKDMLRGIPTPQSLSSYTNAQSLLTSKGGAK